MYERVTTIYRKATTADGRPSWSNVFGEGIISLTSIRKAVAFVLAVLAIIATTGILVSDPQSIYAQKLTAAGALLFLLLINIILNTDKNNTQRS